MKKNATKLISGIISASIILSSCENNLNQQRNYFISDFSEGESVINIDFNKEEIEYLKFLKKLSVDITKHPDIAKKFSESPSLFIKKYGYDKEVDLDEGMLKLILALGDEEINNAIKDNAIKKVLVLLRKKDLLSNTYINIDISEEQKRKMLTYLGVSQSNMNEMELTCTVAVVCIAYIWVGVASQVVAVANVAAAINAAVSLGVYAWVKAFGSNNELDILNKNPSLRIFGIKGRPIDSYIATDIYIEEEVEVWTNEIEEIFPDAFKEVSKDKFKQFMKLNIMSK